MQPDKDQELEQELKFFRKQFYEINQQIRLPDSLEPENMLKLLDGIEPNPQEEKQKPWIYRLKPWASLAACLLVVVGSIFAFKGFGGNLIAEMPSNESAQENLDMAAEECQDAVAAKSIPIQSEGAYYADSYTQLRDTVFKRNGGMEQYAASELDEGAEKEDSIMEDVVTFDDMQSLQSVVSPMMEAQDYVVRGYSGADTQENGVDFVKTDGQYLYSLVEKNSANPSPALYIVDTSNMQVTAKVPVEDGTEEFYISDNRLITVGDAADAIPPEKLPDKTVVGATDEHLVQQIEQNSPSYAQQDAIPRAKGTFSVQANIYDISDRHAPKKVTTFAQDGTYRSSRVENGALYLISDYGVYPELGTPGTPLYNLVPAVYDSASDRARLLDADHIMIDPNSDRTSYTVLSALELRSGQSDVQSVLGGSDGVYFSEDNLYLYRTDYPDVESSQSSETTHILRFSIAQNEIQFAAAGKVSGYPYDPSAWSEDDGFLRILTTANQPSGSTNNIYVLNSEMHLVGSLEDLAPEESIRSLLYVDHTAYLSTFGQTSELLAIDLSNPTKPVQAGKWEASDFSAESLYPVSQDGLLVGVGRSTDSSGAENELKLCLWDVSNPRDMKKLFVSPITGNGSDAETPDIYGATLFDGIHHQIGIPAYNLDSGMKTYSMFSFDRQTGFQLSGNIGNDTETFEQIQRGILINNVWYMCSPDKIVRYSADTLQQKDSIKLI